MSKRGNRNSIALTANQRAEVLQFASELGIDLNDIKFFSGNQSSVYSDLMDKIVIGADLFPAREGPVSGARSVFGRMTPRAALAHEYGHLLAARNDISFPAGSIMEEFQASVLAARHVPGLTAVERFQLIRDAVERAWDAAIDWRILQLQVRHLPMRDG